jgi:hypothetical protein
MATGPLPAIPQRFYTRRIGDTMMVEKICGAGRTPTGVGVPGRLRYPGEAPAVNLRQAATR